MATAHYNLRTGSWQNSEGKFNPDEVFAEVKKFVPQSEIKRLEIKGDVLIIETRSQNLDTLKANMQTAIESKRM